MLNRATLSLLVAAALIQGCGGGGGGDSNQSFPFITPKIGSVSQYTITTIDDSNNSIITTMQNTVTSSNQDGSYQLSSLDPSGNTVVVNGRNYSIVPEQITEDASGQVLSFVANPGTPSAESCTDSPHGAGPDYPLYVGEAWDIAYSESCSNGENTAYTQSGQVVDIEAVSVPAGTFTALRFESTLQWTSRAGTITTESITAWRDSVTSVLVKRQIQYSYTGTPPQSGYPVSATIVLQQRA